MLELIDRRPAQASVSPPLLFVHGFWHGAWCWDEHVMPYLAGHGYDCHAVSLRGHGGSPGRERLRRTRIRDFVDDVVETAGRLTREPVLVGHSMGGFVVQKYLERHSAAGAVLLASVPPTGALRATLNVARRSPAAFLKVNLTLRLGPLVSTPELARAHFFSASMPREHVEAHQRRLQDDSYLALLDLLVLDLVKTRRVRRVPMLVLGASDDALMSPGQVRRTARAYGTQAEIFPDMAHDMMLEPGWKEVAERIAAWLGEQFGDRPTSPPAAGAG
jgi:pimeloyl-ACP methyl ester carboxylesterase